MRIWFIRHALAEEADRFPGPDFERPLTGEGRRQATRLFQALAAGRRGPDLVFASEAVRAWETADIFSVCYRLPRAERTPLLNPGCTLKQFRSLLKGPARGHAHIAVVGHEPDFSSLVSALTSEGRLALKLRKCAVAEVDLGAKGRGVLQAVVSPEWVGP